MSRQMTTTELASVLGVHKSRVSQYVSEGKLDGCYRGEGRQRRFDLEKSVRALGRTLDKGQLLGNGAQTKKALREIGDGSDAVEATPPRPSDGRLNDQDPDRYELARIQKAEEEARRLRRQNAEAEGAYVLASEAARQTARLVAQEIAEFETVLREGARAIADEFGVDVKVARKVLVDKWRAHRAVRAEQLASSAADAEMSADEKAEDI